MVAHGGFSLHFLMTNGVNIYLCLLAYQISSFARCYLLPVFIGFCLFFLIDL